MQALPSDNEPPVKRQRRTVSCDCGVEFSERRALLQHQKTSQSCSVYGNPQKKHVCGHCGDAFARKDVRDKHVRRKHSLVSVVESRVIPDDATSTRRLNSVHTDDFTSFQILPQDHAHDHEVKTTSERSAEVEQQPPSSGQTHWAASSDIDVDLPLSNVPTLLTDCGDSSTASISPSDPASEAAVRVADFNDGGSIDVTANKGVLESGLVQNEHNTSLVSIPETSSPPFSRVDDTQLMLTSIALEGTAPHPTDSLDCYEYLQDPDRVMDLVDWAEVSTWDNTEPGMWQDNLSQTDKRLSTASVGTEEASYQAKASQTSIYRMLASKRRHDRARSDPVVVSNGASKIKLPKCGICGEPYEQDRSQLQAHLDRHLQALNAISDTLTCQDCQVTFVQEQDLKHHRDCAQYSQCCRLPPNHEGKCKGHRCGFNFTHTEPCQGHHAPSDMPGMSADHESFKYGLLLREGLLLRREIAQVGGVTRLREAMSVHSMASCPGGSFFRWSTTSMGASVYTNRSDPLGRLPDIADIESRLSNLKFSSPVARLRRNAARITGTSSRKEEELINAVKQHDLDSISLLVSQGVESRTAILIGTALKDETAVTILTHSIPSLTPEHLYVACATGSATIINALCQSKKVRNLLAVHGPRLLYLAVLLNESESFDALLHAGADATSVLALSQQDFRSIGFSMRMYFKHDTVPVDQYHLTPKAYPAAHPTLAPQYEGWASAILLAAQHGNVAIFARLLVTLADVTVAHDFSRTILRQVYKTAIGSGNFAIVSALLTCGQHVDDVRTRHEASLVDVAYAAEEHRYEIFSLLLRHCASSRAASGQEECGNCYAQGALHKAIEAQDLKLLHLAFKHGATMDAPSGKISLGHALKHWRASNTDLAASVLQGLLYYGGALPGMEEEANRAMTQAISMPNAKAIEPLVRAYCKYTIDVSDTQR